MKTKKGFTIIEVVLVLAIAGLIFLMVFVALPNLQRTQRDTQRRNDVDRASTAMTQYLTNNGRLPSSSVTAFAVDSSFFDQQQSVTGWMKFANNYLIAGGNDQFNDPNGSAYGLMAIECGQTTSTGEGGTTNTTTNCSTDVLDKKFGEPVGDLSGTGIVVFATNARCSENVDDGAFTYTSGTRLFAVAMKLEGNGIYCVDNS